jgi:hypothetical protein
MSDEEPVATLASTPIGPVKVTDSSLIGVSRYDGGDVKKSVDIQLFWGARHAARKKKIAPGR